MKANVKVILINLISEEYLARYQAPLAVNVLAAYFRTVYNNIPIRIIDMQDVFETQNIKEGIVAEVFTKTIESVIAEVAVECATKKTIVGLSVKWSTQKIAGHIINQIRQRTPNSKHLFIIGNIGSTHGYRELLIQNDFKDVVAVIGEGEMPLVNITKKAIESVDDFESIEGYKNIDNVAIYHKNVMHVGDIKRMDLQSYPLLTNTKPSDIYDQEWDVYALETSRGCPWGNCTFCSIKKQFGVNNQKSEKEVDWRWRGFRVDKILDNISWFAKQGVRRFDIKDSEFFGPVRTADDFFNTMNRANEFANGLISLNEELRSVKQLINNNTITITHISARVDTIYSSNPIEEKKNIIRRNTYALLKAAGVKKIYLGIESGSPSQLKRFCKGVSVDENKQAIKILRELGFEIEVGFIFFDYFSSLEELRQNVKFIEETRINETDSRILGSLRIQKGSPYVNMAENSCILGREDSGQLSYDACFINNDVAEIEELFFRWEKSTRKLTKIVPSHLRIENYKMDFMFIKDVLNCYEVGRKDWLVTTVEEHSAIRANFLMKIKHDFDNGRFGKRLSKLCSEYLHYANIQNTLLAKEIAHERNNGGD